MQILNKLFTPDNRFSSMYLQGCAGSGKSQVIRALLERAEDSDDKFIIYDRRGEYALEFYDKRQDDIICPSDRSFKGVNFLNQITDASHLENFLRVVIPDKVDANANDKFWIESARGMLKGVIYYIWANKNNPTCKDIFDFVKRTRDTILLYRLLKENFRSAPCIGKFDPSSPVPFNIHAIMLKHLEDFEKTVSQYPSEGEFSPLGWLNSSSRALFLVNDLSSGDYHKDYFGLIVNQLTEGLWATVKGQQKGRIWLVLDEIGSLPKVVNLIGLLAESRSRRLCIVIATQDLAQMEHIYGHDNAMSLINNCAIKVLGRMVNSAEAHLFALSSGAFTKEDLLNMGDLSYFVSDAEESRWEKQKLVYSGKDKSTADENKAQVKRCMGRIEMSIPISQSGCSSTLSEKEFQLFAEMLIATLKERLSLS